MSNKTYYVTAIDKFMSGWGKAKNKLNKLVFECEDFTTAEKIESKLLQRPEMKYINICTTKPKIKTNHFPSFYNKENAKYWYS